LGPFGDLAALCEVFLRKADGLAQVLKFWSEFALGCW